MPALRTLLVPVLVAAALPAGAQEGSGFRWPSFSNGYQGLNVGRAAEGASCLTTLLPCRRIETDYQPLGTTALSPRFGAEIGNLRLGRAEQGQLSYTQGMSFSLVGRAALVPGVGVYGRVGTVYGRNTGTLWPGTGWSEAGDAAFGFSYGVGLRWDFTPRISATLGWDTYDLRFGGGEREPSRFTSLGLQWRY